MAGSRSTSKQVPKSPEAKIIDSEEDMPNDARAVLEILRSMGIERCEAVVLNQVSIVDRVTLFFFTNSLRSCSGFCLVLLH